MPEKPSVEIPLDYLISTHVMLNQSFEKMKEILGESTALMFFSMASDYQPFGSLGSGDIDFIGGKLSSLLESYGYSLQQTQKGKVIEYRLYCPHADKVHPHLGGNATFCPMSQMVLGAVRKEHKRSSLKKSGLHKDGSSFAIEIQEE